MVKLGFELTNNDSRFKAWVVFDDPTWELEKINKYVSDEYIAETILKRFIESGNFNVEWGILEGDGIQNG